MNQIVQVPGNAEVVRSIETLLAEARRGRINCFAFVAIQPPEVICDFGGNVNMLDPLHGGIEALRDAVRKEIGGKAVPAPNESGADYVTFNFTNGPSSYDVIPFLIDAEMTRIRWGAPAPLKVYWWMGNDNGGMDSNPMRRLMFEKVMRPALAFVGAVETDRIGRCPTLFTALDIVKAFRAGETVPRLRTPHPPGPWLGGQPPVTITLRETPGWPHRNTNMGAWLKFGRYLKNRGERVIFVRDTAKADEKLPGWETDPWASRELHYRMALYESAKCNLFGTNGPTALATYGSRPYLQFITILPDDHACHIDKPLFWETANGVKVGEQWPWALPAQRLVWAKDDYGTIVRAWEELNLGENDAVEARKVTEGHLEQYPNRDQGGATAQAGDSDLASQGREGA